MYIHKNIWAQCVIPLIYHDGYIDWSFMAIKNKNKKKKEDQTSYDVIVLTWVFPLYISRLFVWVYQQHRHQHKDNKTSTTTKSRVLIETILILFDYDSCKWFSLFEYLAALDDDDVLVDDEFRLRRLNRRSHSANRNRLNSDWKQEHGGSTFSLEWM